MFKVIKMINGARQNVPEPVIFQVNGSTPYYAGYVYYHSANGISEVKIDGLHNVPIVPLETLPTNSGINELKCIIATPDMVFETEVMDSEWDYDVGTILSFYQKNGLNIAMRSMQGTDAMVVDKSDALTKNKIHVLLTW